jgi:sugar/nucleoside kinase (ribokinase family)
VKDPRASKKREYESEVAVAGSVAIDLSCDFKGTNSKDQAELPQLLTSNPATMTQSIGGVGHNVAVAAYRASGLDLRTEEHKTRVELFTYVGGDDRLATPFLFPVV